MNIKIALLLNEKMKLARCFEIIISELSVRLQSDEDISEALNIDLEQYRERLKKICLIHEDAYGIWIDDEKLSDEEIIKRFKNEFCEELTILKISNGGFMWCIFLYLLEINGENHINVLYSYFMKSIKIYEIRWYEC